MKKVFAIIMVLALAVSAFALPALAEEANETVDQVTSATTQSGRGSRNNNQHRIPGQNSQNGQMPRMPGQNSQDSQSGQDSQNSQQIQTPVKGNRNMKQGRSAAGRSGKTGTLIDPDQLLKDGVITQEVYDAIMNYLKAQTAQQADTAAPADGTEPPAQPDSSLLETQSMAEQLLKSLLDSGVITREQYDLLLANISAVPAPSDT